MRYDLKIGDREASLEATPPDAEGVTTITAGDTTRTVQIRTAGPHRVQLREGALGEELFVARCAEGIWVWSGGRARLVSDAHARTATRRGSGGGVGGDVTPPMPAVVQELLVDVGDTVEKGDRLVVVSAMKMETTLVAPHGGTVAAVNTEVGAKVAPGDVLVEIAKADGGDRDE